MKGSEPMNPHVYESIPAYLANELSDEERSAVELHLRDCNACSRELDDQKKLDEILDQAHPISPRSNLVQEVMRQVRSAEKQISVRKKSLLPWLAVAAVIAVIVFLLRIQKDTPLPPQQVKKAPAVKPEIQKQPTPKPKPTPPEIEQAPQVTKKNEKVIQPLPQPKQEQAPELSPEEEEVVAQLDELENMDVISNYENLENLELALMSEGESLK
jgi:hypothetical protein